MESKKDDSKVAQFGNLISPVAIAASLLFLFLATSSLDGRDLGNELNVSPVDLRIYDTKAVKSLFMNGCLFRVSKNIVISEDQKNQLKRTRKYGGMKVHH